MDVARRAGLSKATVSKAFNYGDGESTLTSATRDRALRAARELGYRPNGVARSLALHRTHTVGLLHAHTVPPVANEYHRMVHGLGTALREQGYALTYVYAGDSSDAWRAMLLDRRLDGCALVGSIPDGVPACLKEAGLPAVYLNTQAAPRGVAAVDPDERAGARALAEYLLGLGHARLLFYHGPLLDPHPSARLREAGCLEAVRSRRGASARALVAPAAEVVQQMREPHGPTAVICFHELLAIELLHALWRAGLRVPRDASVATFNNTLVMHYTIPPLTTMALPSEELGKRAAADLVALLQASQGKKHRPSCRLLPETLIVRESAAAPPAST